MKARTSRWGFIVSSALVFTLAVSITLGAIFYFYLQMRLYYRDLNQTRLDPLGLSLYPTSLTSKPLEGLPLILFYGDSRAELWPVPVEVDEYQFINRSISGQTSAQISLRFDSHVRPLAPEILLLHVGINDLKTIGLFPTKKKYNY